MNRPLTLGQKAIGVASFTSVYVLSSITLERRFERKSVLDHVLSSSLSGFCVAIGTGTPFVGLATGLALGVASAPVYYYAYDRRGLPTLSDMLKKTESKKDEENAKKKDPLAVEQGKKPAPIAPWPSPPSSASAAQPSTQPHQPEQVK